MVQHNPAKPAAAPAAKQEAERNKRIDTGHPDAEPKGLPNSDRYHAETAHADETQGQEHHAGKGRK